ncbi:MAG TPA: TGS domain-containing protein, partial [Candidatus Eisenbacteria bacterium]|nr:TGS domain-containing protein [Candidatus Eisenbacteria bacterium]
MFEKILADKNIIKAVNKGDLQDMEIKLMDGSALEVKERARAYDAALAISEGLARNVYSAKINGE